ncbi:MAG: glycosyltransferase, partial [Pseudomonadota bacterium]
KQHLSPVILGEVPHDKVLQLLANVDIHVTSSLKETFGRTVQESLYVGTPVLAPDCDWTRNLITPNFNGALYQPEDGEDFIKKLTELINQPSFLAKLRTNLTSNHNKIPNKNDPAFKWIEYLCNIIKRKEEFKK